MTAVLLPSLVLHTAAFLLQLSTIAASSQTTEPPEQQGCSSARACGSLNISHPFWLEEPGRPPCGSPSFQLKCNSSGAFLSRSMFQAYRVVNIFSQNNSVHVVDENLPLAGGCPAPCFNLSLAMGSMAAFVVSRANSELRFLSRCAEPVPEAVRGFQRMPCDNNSFVGFRRRFGSYDDRGHGATPPGCLVSVVPTLPATDRDSRHNYVASLRRGFLLEWTVVSGDCSKCTASGGECMYPDNGLGFSCNCPDGIHYPVSCGSKRTGGRKIMLIVQDHSNATNNLYSFGCKTVLMAVAGTLLLLPCIYVLICHRKGQKPCFLIGKTTISKNERNIEVLISSHGSLAPKRYKYSEATKITSYMNNKLGEGGYGVVFKGGLNDGRLVAVKFLHDSKAKGEEFVNEVMSIGRTSHVNIVSLYGFCLEGSKRALIYEYMANGSLDKYIYSKNPKEILGWERLYAIAVGIARGLEYLHHSCNTRIVHFDIKPQNILLDHDFCPKIADFGLAKLCHTKESKLSVTGARGTIGFIAPEVHSRTFGVASTKSDVYSYGMLLLEMVGGRKNVKLMVEKSSQKYFPDWIYDHYAQNDGLLACEVPQEDEEIARKMILIGLWCIQILPMHRPTITKVLEMFESGSDELEMPSKQNFSQVIEDLAYNMNAESTSPSSTMRIQAYSDLNKLEMPPKQKFSQILEDSVYNLNTESMSPSSSAETQGSSEGLKAEEIKHVNSKLI